MISPHGLWILLGLTKIWLALHLILISNEQTITIPLKWYSVLVLLTSSMYTAKQPQQSSSAITCISQEKAHEIYTHKGQQDFLLVSADSKKLSDLISLYAFVSRKCSCIESRFGFSWPGWTLLRQLVVGKHCQLNHAVSGEMLVAVSTCVDCALAWHGRVSDMSFTRTETLVVRSILMQSLHELVPPLSWLKGVQIQYVLEHPLLHRLYLQNISRYE